jgi:hypothetical protein
MRAGVFVAYWPWFSPSEQVELAVPAGDRAGAVPCGDDRPAVVRALAAATVTK